MNPRRYKYDCNSWYWNVQSEVCKLKTKATVIKAGTIVEKDNTGKIEGWNITSSSTTGALYIVLENTVKAVERCVCISAGEVLISALQYPSGMSWESEKGKVTILDSMNLRSQIRLI